MEKVKKDNKQAAIDFLQMIVAGDIDAAYKKHTAPGMIHHNAFFSGDAKSLQKGMEENHKEYPNKIFEIQHTVAESDIVIVHSHLRMNTDDKGMATIHIFRFQGEKIVEMWDIAQQVPEDSPNKNGMF